jgi:hypothetical protein
VTVRGFTLEQSAPELPPLYRQYWEEDAKPTDTSSESS